MRGVVAALGTTTQSFQSAACGGMSHPCREEIPPTIATTLSNTQVSSGCRMLKLARRARLAGDKSLQTL